MTNPWTVLATIYVLAKGKIYLAKTFNKKCLLKIDFMQGPLRNTEMF